MAEKSRDAFRTISEVADWLDVPTHVLRFWESRFSQIKPVKRAGGRRYYRPSDMRVIGGVKVLLHDQGMTIRGVQKLFREEGIKHVANYAPSLFDEDVEAEPPALNEAALETAARPAPAARSTHSAEPDPVEAEAPAPEDKEAAPETVMFRRASREPDAPAIPKPALTSESTEEKAQDTLEAAPEEPTSSEKLAIPPTPDVPETDPSDDAEEHVKTPSVAARLRMADPAHLSAHQETLAAAVVRLRSLAERVG